MTNAENLLVRCHTILHQLHMRPLSVQMLVDLRDEYRIVQDELRREVARLREADRESL